MKMEDIRSIRYINNHWVISNEINEVCDSDLLLPSKLLDVIPLNKSKKDGHIRIAMLNALADCFPWFIEIAIQSQLRFNALLEEIERIDADVLTLCEVTPRLTELLVSSKFVQQNYYISDDSHLAHTPHGCLILSKYPFENIFRYPFPSSLSEASTTPTSPTATISSKKKKKNDRGRDVIIGRIAVGGDILTICSAHTTAYSHNKELRGYQISELVKSINDKFNGKNHSLSKGSLVIMGDLNMHDECEDGIVISNGLLDLWCETHHQNDHTSNAIDSENGFTFNSKENKLIPKYIPGEYRQMRLDRILVSDDGFMWKPKSPVSMFANQPIKENSYLFISDHYGLYVDLERSEKPLIGNELVSRQLKRNSQKPPHEFHRSFFYNTVVFLRHFFWLFGLKYIILFLLLFRFISSYY